MRILINESFFDGIVTKVNSLVQYLFVGVPRGRLNLSFLKDKEYFAAVLLENGDYGFIPEEAYLGTKKVFVRYHNGTEGEDTIPNVDESKITRIQDASMEQLSELSRIIQNKVNGFNSHLKYTT